MPTRTSELDDLRAALTGRLVGPGDADYDTTRSVWNGGSTGDRPSLPDARIPRTWPPQSGSLAMPVWT